jgi:hypothetical protein
MYKNMKLKMTFCMYFSKVISMLEKLKELIFI